MSSANTEVNVSGRWLSQVRKGLIEYCILETLARQGESYGYAIVKSLNEREALSFNESAVYLALGRMLEAGMLASTTKRADNGRQRRYFTATASGHATLETMRQEWQALVMAIASLQQDPS